jgi:hypothetical protein
VAGRADQYEAVYEGASDEEHSVAGHVLDATECTVCARDGARGNLVTVPAVRLVEVVAMVDAGDLVAAKAILSELIGEDPPSRSKP